VLTDAELERLLEENESLRDEVGQLRGQSPPGSVTDDTLCSGCYKHRLILGVLAGVPVAVLCWLLFGDMGINSAVQSNHLRLDKDDAMLLRAAATVVAAAVPVLLTVFEWKWRLYKNGYAGVLRGIAECWRAFQEGRGRT
jgi:hypothetical protein